MAEVVLEFPARPEYLHLARQVVAAAAELEPTFRDDRIDDLRLAVSEATTNAVEAHLHAGGEERIVVRCDLGEDRIRVEIRDQGGGIDDQGASLAGGLPDPEARDRLERERGLGLPLMAHLADETEIRSRDGGTSVHLTVYVPDRFRTPPGSGAGGAGAGPPRG